jgi:hypothetical protein
MTATSQTVRVETKSAWLSKINWTQAVGIAASLLVFATGGQIDIPLETQTEIVVAIQALQGVATWVFKTWFTPTITLASASVSGEKTMTLD